MEKQQDDLLLNLIGTPEFIEDREKKILDALEKCIDVNAKDKNGETALMKAVCRKKTDLIPLLIDKGADTNAKDTDGETALMKASENGYTDLALLLIDKGADINAKDAKGQTALMKASLNRRKNVVQLLLDKGAKTEVKDICGKSAFLYAGGDSRLEKMFEDAEKKSIREENTPIENNFPALGSMSSQEKTVETSVTGKTLATDKELVTGERLATDKKATLKETLAQSELGLSPEYAGLEKNISLTVTGKILENKGR